LLFIDNIYPCEMLLVGAFFVSFFLLFFTRHSDWK